MNLTMPLYNSVCLLLEVTSLCLPCYWAHGVPCVSHAGALCSAASGREASERAMSEWLNMCSGAGQRTCIKGEERGALLCVGGLFRLGFGKLLREHVETPNPFHPHCSQETTALPLLLMVHVVKMLLPRLRFLSSSPSSHSPPPFPTLVFLLASPVLPSPVYSILRSACLHRAVRFMQRVFLRKTCVYVSESEVHDVRMYERACLSSWTCAVASLHLLLEKRAVMSLTATRTLTASQSCPLVLRPPRLCSNTNQEQQLAQRGEDAGFNCEEREVWGVWGGEQRRMLRPALPARINGSTDCLLLLFVYMWNRWKRPFCCTH